MDHIQLDLAKASVPGQNLQFQELKVHGSRGQEPDHRLPLWFQFDTGFAKIQQVENFHNFIIFILYMVPIWF